MGIRKNKKKFKILRVKKKYGWSGLLRLVYWGFLACPGIFRSCCEENDPDPKSGRDLDKLVYATFCRGYVTDPAFLRIFL